MAENDPLKCNCGIPVARRQSWTSKNPGRKFICCKLSEPDTEMKGCKLFKWTDSHMEEWQRVVINNLIQQRSVLEVAVSDLEAQRSMLLEENDRLKMKYKAARGDLKRHLKMVELKKEGRSLCKVFGMLLLLAVAIYIAMY